MAFDRTGGGHYFEFGSDKCVKCDMTRNYYEDNGKPRCTGEPPRENNPIPIDED